MKNINWVKIVLYVIGVLIIFRIFASIYTSGFFHSKEIFVNHMKLTAPKDCYLVGVSNSDDKYSFDAFSPMRLNFGSKYIIDNNESINIIFANLGKKFRLKDIFIEKTNKIIFNKTLLGWGKMQNDTITLFKNRYGQCSDIYRIMKTSGGDYFGAFLLFNEERKMKIYLTLTHEEDVNISLDEICCKKN